MSFKIADLRPLGNTAQAQAAAVLVAAFAAVVGFVAATPQYGDPPQATGWDLHPLAVDPAWQGRGVAQALVAELERRVAALGAVTLFAMSDDETSDNSLSGIVRPPQTARGFLRGIDTVIEREEDRL